MTHLLPFCYLRGMTKKNSLSLPSDPPAWYLDLSMTETYPPEGQPFEVRWRDFEGSSWGVVGARVDSGLSLRVLEGDEGYWSWVDSGDTTKDDGQTYGSVEAAQLGAVRLAIEGVEEELVDLDEEIEAEEASLSENPDDREEFDYLRGYRENIEEVMRVLREEAARLEAILG